ncbi:MAG: hypothetical protein ACOYNB_01105 [Aquabacterium sp.]|uniref:hypothetical protein n=1 Tax=Aquabacterium sp. TaxID=1872578 RepID=UPI003BC37318
MAIRAVALVGACVLSFLFWTAFHIPDFSDADVANQVAQDVTTAYGHFPPHAEADKTGHGKVLYAHPGAGKKPTLVVYEVTDLADRDTLIQAARQAMSEAHANGITVQFFERQNVTHYDGGGLRRGPERLIDTVELKPGT